MSRARGANSSHAIAFESTYGTAPGSGFRSLPLIRNGLGSARALIEDDTLGHRDTGDHDLDVPNIDGDLEVPVDATAFGNILRAALGAPVTTEASGVYTHVFSSGAWDVPSFSLEKGMPDVPVFEMYRGCKLDRLRFSMQRSGKVSASVSVIGKNQVNPAPTTTQAGTPATYERARFVQAQGALTLDGGAFANVVSANFNYSNGLERVETIESDGSIGGLDEAVATLALSLTVRFASTALLSNALSGTPVAVNLSLTRSATESLTFAIPRLFLPEPKTAIEGPNGVQVTFEAMASQQQNGGPMATATLINAVSAY